MSALVVNLFAGPGAGKSSTAAGLFSYLKWAGIECELATEYAKDRVWSEDLKTLGNQIYVFGKQHHRIHRLKDKVEVIITDSPLLLSILYDDDKNDSLQKLVMYEFKKCNNLNIFLKREKPYVQTGRLQTEEEAKQIDRCVQSLLKVLGEEFLTFPGTPDTVPLIGDLVKKRLGK